MMAVFAAAVVLTGGCGGGPGTPSPGTSGPSTSGQGKAQPTMTPAGRIDPPTGSGDLADPIAQLCRDCERKLKNGDASNASLAEQMARVASDSDSTDTERAVALPCLAAAQANMGNYSQALDSSEKAQQLFSTLPPSDLPPKTRRVLEELLFHTELISAAAVGDSDRAQEALARLTELGYKPGKYVRETCAVASDPATLPECATATPSATMTESPSGEPETPVTPQPKDSSTGPTGDTTPTDGATEAPNEGNPVSPDGDDDAPAPNES